MDYVQISAEIIHGLIEVLRTVSKNPLVDYVRVSAKIIHGFIKDLRISAYIRKYSSSVLVADIRRINPRHY